MQFLFVADPKNIESVYQTPGEIPKTIIFFDSRKDAHTAAEECEDWLLGIRPQYFTHHQVTQSLQVFHRNTAPTDKKSILTEFAKEGAQSQIRVIFGTEALGMGVDLPDIRRTVQWGIPTGEHAATQLQRGGRASRDKLDGEMIILLPDWLPGQRSSRPIQQRSKKKCQGASFIDTGEAGLKTGEDTPKAKKLTDEQRRDNLPDFWYNLANSERKDPPECLRRQFLDFFDEPNEFRSHRRPDRCCSNCNPETQLGKLEGFYQYQEHGPRGIKRTKAVSDALETWAGEQANLVYRGCACVPRSTFFLSPDLREKLAKNAHLILDMESLQQFIGSWYWRESHGKALFSVIQNSYRSVSTQTSNSQISQSQIPGPSSQSIVTTSSFGLSTLVVAPPLLAGSMLAQAEHPSWPNLSDRGFENITSLTRPAVSKRPALEPISGNIPAKKVLLQGAKNPIN